MTNPQPEKSLAEEYDETEEGAQDLAAADLAAQAIDLISRALQASDLDQKALAAKLGVTEGRVSQVVNSDGNLRIAALARYLRALGYNASISAQSAEPDLPELATPRHGRRHEPIGTWTGLSKSHAPSYRVVAMSVGGLFGKRLAEGFKDASLLANIGWSEQMTFSVEVGDDVFVWPTEVRGDDHALWPPLSKSRESRAGRGR
jgi:transcriptional regulator with XRE-family HTH domain